MLVNRSQTTRTYGIRHRRQPNEKMIVNIVSRTGEVEPHTMI